MSDTLTDGELTWKPATIIRGADLVDSVAALRDKAGRRHLRLRQLLGHPVLAGGGVVDELVLMIEPITLGGG